MKSIKWVAGFFEDQAGTGSSKRLAMYIALYYLKIIIDGNLNDNQVSEEVLFAVVVIILFSIGAITSEFFKDVNVFKKTNTKTSTEEVIN